MSTSWQLQDAKNRFSQVVEEALRDGPQTVTRRGEPVVVVVSVETWEKMNGSRPSLKAYLRDGALDGLDLDRDATERRPVDLP
ncbi:MAG: type II toxin-antitoxin system prevent-host-death family antitoxin [Alphaproteobacteria bacterium]|nr:type II toxin-antitoxin system prevent-host-death family antitoxin [Alphaproteobacteria bacterium]